MSKVIVYLRKGPGIDVQEVITNLSSLGFSVNPEIEKELYNRYGKDIKINPLNVYVRFLFYCPYVGRKRKSMENKLLGSNPVKTFIYIISGPRMVEYTLGNNKKLMDRNKLRSLCSM